jgi:CheY-like chemotaxis protein
MSFPFYRRPGGVVFLDDDPAYLEMLAEVMPEQWHVRLFLRPSDCISHLQQQPLRREEDAWLHRDILDSWREGQTLIAQILRYWREDEVSRFGLTQVCVVDYSMPAMNGLEVLGELANWSGARVLLTGRADEQIAVNAFNDGLITQYIPKQATEITRRLTDLIQRLMNEPWDRHAPGWRATLSREQAALIATPAIGQQLTTMAVEQHWIEHIVIGDPFGIVALNDTGQAFWLQLEPEGRLQELAEMAACHGLPEAAVRDICAGHCLFNVEFHLAVGSSRADLPPALRLGDGPVLYAALTRVPETLCPGLSQSYSRFLHNCGLRELEDRPPAVSLNPQH